MKKYIIILTFIIIFLIPSKISASSISTTLKCPTTASAGEIITCSINTSNSGDINGISGKFSFSGGASYSNFSFNEGYQLTLQNFSSQGFQMGISKSFPTNGGIANLFVKIAEGVSIGSQHTVTLSDIQASTINYEDVTGTGNTQTITIISSNNYLKSLSITGANINFNKNTTSYTVKINNSTATINATVEDSHATISGVGNVNVKEGKNTFNIIVTAQSGEKRTYTIIVNRTRQNASQPTQPVIENPESDTTLEETPIPEVPGSDGLHAIEAPNNDNKKDPNNKLKSLNIDKIKIPFNNSILEYDLYVGYEIDEIRINAKTYSKKAKIDGNTIHKLIIGRNVIRITVTAENGEKRIYEIIIYRDKEEKKTKDNKLKKLTIDGVDLKFNKDKNNYTIKTLQKTLNIKATLENKDSSYSIKGNNNLIDGSEVRIKVTDREGNLNVYKIKIDMPDNLQNNSPKFNDIIINLLLFLIGGIVGFTLCYYSKINNKKRKKYRF